MHSIDTNKNAERYGIHTYPLLEPVIGRIRDASFMMRANLLLSKHTIHTAEEFEQTRDHLISIGAHTISAWSIRNDNDEVDTQLMPTEDEWHIIEGIASPYLQVCLLGESSRTVHQKKEKLTLFPNGQLSNTGCNQ